MVYITPEIIQAIAVTITFLWTIYQELRHKINHGQVLPNGKK